MPPPLGLMFLMHQMIFPATLDNHIPQNVNTLGKSQTKGSLPPIPQKTVAQENSPISEPAIIDT